MGLAAGVSLGPYTIVAPLGTGGMGEVYRARDSRLDRDVAIKVLPADVAHDPQRLERFAREARAAAALNHSNILAVYDVAADGDVHYLVSELLDGQTLADRLAAGAGALAVRKAVEIAQQIAQALGAAHARGIVHRDLKPANVFVTSDGRVKLLDFGLAKEASAAPATVATTTVARTPPTDAGQVLGTVGYMAPEQVRGQAVDARADIFAFGCVLYEMLAGQRAFQADTAADTISAILGKDPPDLVSSSAHSVSPALQRIAGRCLEKDPAARFQSAADLAFALQALTNQSTPSGTGSVASPPGGASTPERRGRDAVLVAVALVGVGVGIASWLGRPQPSDPLPQPVAQFDLSIPGEILVEGLRLTLSPDGRWLHIYNFSSHWLRSMADGAMTRIAQGQVRGAAAWSPDGSALAILGTDELRFYRPADGSMTPSVSVGQLNFPITSAWSYTGDVLFSDGVGRIVRIRLDDLTRVDVVRDGGDSGESRRLVGFLPGGDTYLFVRETGAPDQIGLFATSLAHDTPRRLDGSPWSAGTVVDATTVLLKRGSSIVEQRLQPGATALDGPARVLLTDGAGLPRAWAASANGVLVVAAAQERRFRWRSRSGGDGPTVGPSGHWAGFSLSPDGTRLVAARDVAAGDTRRNLWTIDSRGVEDRLTFGDARDNDPIVSSDGRVVFSSGDGVNTAVTARIVEAGSEPRTVATDPAGLALDDWSRDGRWLAYHQRSGMPGAEPSVLFAVDLTAPAATRRVARCTGGTLDEAHLSPDGRWVAFNCDESGRNEVYVTPFPEGGTRVRVSVDGGVQPAWRGDGREIYFLSLGGVMMAADVALQPELRSGPPRRMFETGLTPTNQTEQFRVTADGQRFLIAEPADRALPLRVIINWRERFKAESP